MKQLPTEPGTFYWTEWAQYVTVYAKTKTFKPGQRLYTRLPGGIEVRISPRIAGNFIKMGDKGAPKCTTTPN